MAHTTSMLTTIPLSPRRYTVEEVLAFPEDGNQYELVDGELLVSPTPTRRHQHIVHMLAYWVTRYLDQHDLARVLCETPADLSWEAGQIFHPDLFVIHPSEMRNDWREVKTLLLAVEVLSPSTRLLDRSRKRPVYQRHGVQTFWIVDPDAQNVEVWHPGDVTPQIVTDVLSWQYKPDAPLLHMALDELFN